ncbi:MAG: hypothetical protein ACE5HX_19100, partial [bacterium]
MWKNIIIALLVTLKPILGYADKFYDIKHYDLSIQPDFYTKSVDIKAILTIENPQLQDTLYFGVNSRYGSVAVQSRFSPVIFEQATGWIKIIVKQPEKKMKLIFDLQGLH